jgi:hypothetical protein
MARGWHPEEGKAASANELRTMACVLEGRHGVLAVAVAEFLASSHRQTNDMIRGSAWARVADIVRQREVIRLAGHDSVRSD